MLHQFVATFLLTKIRQHSGRGDSLRLLAIREQVLSFDLVLEGCGALWLYIPHDHYPSLRVVPEVNGEASDRLRRLRNALLAIDVGVGQESDFAGRVGAGEVEGGRAAFRAAV